MLFIADGLLIAGGVAAAFYCWVLARRVRGLTDMDNGVGAAISALSRQVDEVKSSLDLAKAVTGASRKELAELTARAEISAGRLELLLAALHERGEAAPAGADRFRRGAQRRRGERPGDAEAPEPPAAKPAEQVGGDDAPAAGGETSRTDAAKADAPPPRRERNVTPALKSVLKALDR